MNFKSLEAAVYDCYTAGDYSLALEHAKEAAARFPEKKAETLFWVACLLSKTGDTVQAMKVLRSSLQEGYWWSPKILMAENDFEPLRGQEEFREILDLCREAESEAIKNLKPELYVFCPPNYSAAHKYPLLLGIHLNGGNAEQLAGHFCVPPLKQTTVLAFPQSSHICGKGQYYWDDMDRAVSEISNAYREIISNHNIDPENIIIAGASRGGRLAVELALGTLPCKGFIAVVPALKEATQYSDLLEKGKGLGVKGCIITGDKDNSFPGVIELDAQAQQRGFPLKLIINNGMGHYFPKDFPEQLVQALEFLNS